MDDKSIKRILEDESECADFALTAKLGEILSIIRYARENEIGDNRRFVFENRAIELMLERNLRVDHREYWLMLEYMQECGFAVTHLDTGTGDYASTNVSFERKASDLTSSVWDERLYRQLSMMTELSEHSFVVITREYKTLKRDLRRRGVNPQVLIGFIASMAAMGYPPIFIPDEYDAAQLIEKLIHKLEDDRNRLYSPRPKKATPEAYRNAIVESLPGVGYKLRKRILKQFSTIEELVSASVEDLLKVDGIGPKMAAKIHAALH